MYKVYQHWDPLKVCVVGRSYPPEFYSWVNHAATRNLLERIAEETEEDYQKIIRKLESFGVQVMRPHCANTLPQDRPYKQIPPPPMTPRDSFVMIGETLYRHRTPWEIFYSNIRDAAWPETVPGIEYLTESQQQECRHIHHWGSDPMVHEYAYRDIVDHVSQQGNRIEISPRESIIGSMVSRIGRDLYFATDRYDEDPADIRQVVDQHFTQTRNHVVNTGGHGDGTYCPVAPGLIISLNDVPTYVETFPGWEVIYLPNQSWHQVESFMQLKEKNQGRWWIEDAPIDDHFIDFVSTWMSDWVGYVEETVFDVNMLMIDPKNVMVFNENETVFRALERYGITPHVVTFRHRYFWDGGIHCVTLDLDRTGEMQDFFPDRG